MRKAATIWLLAAALLASLPGCASRSAAPGVHSTALTVGAAPLRSFAAACPTPTPDARKIIIADELEAAIPTGRPPNVLAEEWERLDEGARICREKSR